MPGRDEETGATLELRLANHLRELARLHRELADFLEPRGVPRRAAMAAHLVAEELVSNTVKYGYLDEGRREIEVRVTADRDGVLVRLSDDAAPFDPFAAAPGVFRGALADAPTGGWGLRLVESVTREARYRREDGRNLIEVRVPKGRP